MKNLVFIAFLVGGCTQGGVPGGDASGVADLAGVDLFGVGDGGYQPPWSTLRPLPQPRQETGVVELGGKIYVIGGFNIQSQVVDTVEVYDPVADTWAPITALPRPIHHANAAVVNGKIYVVGAIETIVFTAVGDVYIFDPGNNQWTTATAMPAGTQRGASMVGVIGNKIYVAGGYRGGTVGDFSVYDTVADTWTPLAALVAPRDHGVGAVVGGKLHAIGGRNGSIGGHTNRVDVYDPLTNGWTSRTPMPTSRGGSAAGVVGGRIIVAGGEGNAAATSGVFDVTEIYDPVTNLWSTLTPMKTPRHGTGGATVGPTFYVPGGASKEAFGAVNTVEAITP